MFPDHLSGGFESANYIRSFRGTRLKWQVWVAMCTLHPLSPFPESAPSPSLPPLPFSSWSGGQCEEAVHLHRFAMVRARAGSAPRRAFVLLVLVLVAGLAPGAKGEGWGQRRGSKRSPKERDYENKLVNDEDDTVVYEKVKNTLRNIFAKGVEPAHAEDEGIKDYLEPDFDDPQGAFSNQIPVRNDLSEATSSLRSSPTRRRGLVQDDEDLLESAEDLAKRGYANAHRGTHAHSKLHSVAHGGREHTKAFLNEWAVHMTGGQELARAVAKDLGYQFLGQVSPTPCLCLCCLSSVL